MTIITTDNALDFLSIVVSFIIANAFAALIVAINIVAILFVWYMFNRATAVDAEFKRRTRRATRGWKY